MGYRFKTGRSLAKNAKKVATERIDSAIDSLRVPSQREAGVHAARKCFKKTRSLLRLLRPALGRHYREENDGMRELGHRLEPLREADAMAACLQLLVAKQATLRDAVDYQQISDAFASEAHDDSYEQDWFDKQIIEPLLMARERVPVWSARLKRTDEGDILEAGLRHYYGRGRDALRRVLDDPEHDGLVHEWRKRAKDLWYHHRLLKEAWPGPLGCIAEELDALCDLLGDHHDLTQLRERLLTLPMRESERWLRSIHEEQRTMLHQAIPLGHRIWQEKPKRFANRLSSYWLSARKAAGG